MKKNRQIFQGQKKLKFALFSFIGIMFSLLSAVAQTGGGTVTVGPLLLPPDLGQQNAYNNYKFKKVLVYENTFEHGLAGLILNSPGSELIQDTNEVITGHYSLKGTNPLAQTDFTLPAYLLNLQPSTNYLIEYDYKIIEVNAPNAIVLGVGLHWTGLTPPYNLLGGIIAAAAPVQGKGSYTILLNNVTDAYITFHNIYNTAVIDNIRIYRCDKSIESAAIPLIKRPFPRLSNYLLESPLLIAMINKGKSDDVLKTLSYFDMVNGSYIDHTFGTNGWQVQLKELNPEIILLPYKQAYMADHLDEKVVGGSAKLPPLFNRGLIEEWFVHKPNGERMNQFLYPQNFQLNHTTLAPRYNGWSLIDYIGYFLSHSVLSSGLWDGIHFDQADWIVNSLLDEDPFDLPPPIDLDYDGIAESVDTVYKSWREAYVNYFNFMQKNLGASKFFFGNGGHISANPTMLSYLNGWQREVASPYKILENGDWETSSPGGWYDLFKNYSLADKYARAPQINSIQSTGKLLGIPTGTFTPNSLPDRVQQLEERDMRRMRLGLTTTLLGNGFFGYTYVDNTSLPVWFDEYAVNTAGEAEQSLAAKGYLGQPLGDAYELTYPKTVVFNLDFESLPPVEYFSFAGQFNVTTQPNEVISGGQSLVVTHNDVNQPGIVLISKPDKLPLEVGATYHFTIDYKILEHKPTKYSAFFGIGIAEDGMNYKDQYRFSSLYYLDVDSPGQQGTLRTAIKVKDSQASTYLLIQDTGKVVFDNIKLVKATGGMWRRDFENGVVLVNPTPEALTITQAELAGTLNRTQLKKIKGTQAPTVNTGLPVTGSLSLPPADGIILLANRITASAPSVPEGLSLQAAEEDIMALKWQPAAGTVAGYLIKYGKEPTQLHLEHATGPIPKTILKFLERGTTYYFQIAAYDYLGNCSSFSSVSSFTTTGEVPATVPGINVQQSSAALVPGHFFTLVGKNLALNPASVAKPPFPLSFNNTYVEINGIRAPLIAVFPDRIEGLVPWAIGGQDALVVVTYNGVQSACYKLPVRKAKPEILTWDGRYGIAVHTNLVAVLDTYPARPGEYITFVATSPGLIEPYPGDGGALPVNFTLANSHSIMINETTKADILMVKPFEDKYGYYSLTIRWPENIPAGEATIQLKIADETSPVVILCAGSAPGN